MKDFPMDGDISFPVSPDSSAMDLLSSLYPHSPTAQLGFAWSFDDIPLMLYDEAYAGQPLISDSEGDNSILVTETENQHSLSPHRFSIGSRAEHDYDVETLSSSGSSETICSAATFGAKMLFESSTVEMQTCSADSLSITEGKPLWQSQKSPSVSEGPENEGTIPSDRLFSYGAQQPTKNNSDTFLSRNAEDSYFSPLKSRISICKSAFERSPSFITAIERNFDDELDSGKPKKTGIKSWISPHDWNRQEDIGTIAQEDNARFPTQSQLASDEHVELELPLVSRFSSNSLESPNPGLKPANVSLPNALGVIQDHHQISSSDNRRPPSSLSSLSVEDFPWLKDITVQFLIDQEGFRDAEPCFRFCSLRSVSQLGKSEKLMAQFRPVSRQHFHFHHAPLESPPVLRRITVNDDGTTDYVSRQAHLTLKLNGVFVVQGHEMPSAHNSESSKLDWQFEYVVDNRRIDIAGSSRDLEGEKTLTPLTFSCTPELLLPSQAKRINIMHIFKKSVAPKIVAEKLQPPASTRFTADSVHGSNVNYTPILSEAASRLKNEHFYDQGDYLRRLDEPDVTDGNVHSTKRITGGRVFPHDVIHKGISMDNDRYRVAFSSNKHNSASADSPNPKFTRLAVDANSPATRHIFPPDRLSELLEFSTTENDETTRFVAPELIGLSRRLSTMTMISDLDSKELVALSPRPKYT